ncbi:MULTISPECIES: hypothetical protein [Sphingobacterium]|uniref:Uncharacterized protein n=1 Tax=Sphingobacterium tenebrionis TaxID=3111775 RepID=A0ABU8I6K0_9SPHI|nr:MULTISPECIES: hypothetical protein [unclassified Sphingobacterium]QBR12849.1 hypothetical protein E3D81_12030 [Sphingobacterium sp. CZ-2]
MDNLKFEISTISQNQLSKVKEVLNDLVDIKDWQIAPYIDGYLVSVRGINLRCYAILQSLLSIGVNAEKLYEE